MRQADVHLGPFIKILSATKEMHIFAVFEKGRDMHGDYGSFTFQMSHQKIPGGDLSPITKLELEDPAMYNERMSVSAVSFSYTLKAITSR